MDGSWGLEEREERERRKNYVFVFRQCLKESLEFHCGIQKVKEMGRASVAYSPVELYKGDVPLCVYPNYMRSW